MGDSYKDIFTKRIKEARKIRGYTQADVEEEINIAKSSLSKYEHGTMQPTLNVIGSLANLYDVSVDWLFGLGRHSGLDVNMSDREEIKKREKAAKREMRAKKQVGFFGDISGGSQSIKV